MTTDETVALIARIAACEPKIVDDGFGNTYQKCDRPNCSLEVVRPGKVQCDCDTEGLTYCASTEAGLSGWLTTEDMANVIERQARIIRGLRNEAICEGASDV